jgi:hypothetical protein
MGLWECAGSCIMSTLVRFLYVRRREEVVPVARMNHTIVGGVVLIALVGIAYTVGRLLGATDCVGVTSLATLLAAVLSLIALVRGPTAGRSAGVALLVWLVAASVTEQFSRAYDAHGVVVGLAWLILPTVGGVVLLGRSLWWAGVGCSSAMFAGVTALAYTRTHSSSGVGLVLAWMS